MAEPLFLLQDAILPGFPIPSRKRKLMPATPLPPIHPHHNIARTCLSRANSPLSDHPRSGYRHCLPHPAQHCRAGTLLLSVYSSTSRARQMDRVGGLSDRRPGRACTKVRDPACFPSEGVQPKDSREKRVVKPVAFKRKIHTENHDGASIRATIFVGNAGNNGLAANGECTAPARASI